MNRGWKEILRRLDHDAVSGDWQRAEESLRQLLLLDAARPGVAGALAEGAALVSMARRNAHAPDPPGLSWEAGRMARRHAPHSEAVAVSWARTLCHLISLYGSVEAHAETIRCEEELLALAGAFPESEGVQYWYCQSQFEMVAVLALRGAWESLASYLRTMRRVCGGWPGQMPYWALYAMALANAVAACSQIQQVEGARQRLEELREVDQRFPGEREIAMARARALQQAAWYCGEQVSGEELFGWIEDLVGLLEQPVVRSDCGAMAVGEFGVYAMHFLKLGYREQAARVLREGCRLLESVAVDPEEIPLILDTFRRAAQSIRAYDPALAEYAEQRCGRLLV